MVNSQGCAVRKEEEEDSMFRRIWKKFKGSHPEDDVEGEPETGQEDRLDESAPDDAFQSATLTTTCGVEATIVQKSATLCLNDNFAANNVGDDEVKGGKSHESDATSASRNLHNETFEKSSSEEGDVSPRGNRKISSGDVEDDDESVSSSGSSASSSSSDSFCSVEEEIIVPTHRIGSNALSTSGHDQSSPAGVDAPSPTEAVPHFDLELLARTHFPDFEFESVPDGELTESSDDESTLRKKEEKYKTKEDQDVAVFMDLAKRLNIKSLLHLLQGHVRANNPPIDYLRRYNDALESSESNDTSTSSQLQGVIKTKPLAKQKQFRWAEVTDEKVRAVVHEVPSVKDHKALWWTPKEMQAIRAELIDVVQFFRKRRPEYIQSIEIVARQQESEAVIDEHMKLLAADSFPRGLETHIVKMLSDHRRSTIRAVLDEQKECRYCNDNEETTMHCIREQSLAYSQLSTRFASSLAKCDEIDALKASMCRWRGTSATGTYDFFT